MQEESCGVSTIRVIFLISNFIYVIVGIAVLGAGVGATIIMSDVKSISGATIMITPLVIIAVGVIILVVATFGFIGAIRENRCAVVTYSIMLGVLLVAEFACAVAAFMLRNKIKSILKHDLINAMVTHENNTNMQKGVDFLQRKFKCCGVDNTTEVKKRSSCCIKKDCDVNSKGETFKDGCVIALTNLIKSKIMIVGFIALGVCIVEIMCIGIGCFLGRAIEKAYEPV